MVETNDGFKIAETDMQLRGPGDMMGTQQSGALDLLISDLGADSKILQVARIAAQNLTNEDSKLSLQKNLVIKNHIQSLKRTVVNWSRIG